MMMLWQPHQILDVPTNLTFQVYTDKLHGSQLPPQSLHMLRCHIALSLCPADQV